MLADRVILARLAQATSAPDFADSIQLILSEYELHTQENGDEYFVHPMFVLEHADKVEKCLQNSKAGSWSRKKELS